MAHRYPHVERAESYVAAVLNGEEVAGKFERLACERHRSDMARAVAGWDYKFDPVKAERVCRFIETLPHIKGEWAQRRELLSLEGWQCFQVCSLFGWVGVADGFRRFRQAYMELGRKNAKSTLLAGIGLWLLALDGEAGAEVYSAATTKDQAKIIFKVAKAMTERTAEFRVKGGVVVQAHTLSQPATESIMTALATQTNSLDGLNPHGSMIDELHAHTSREVVDVIRSGAGARRQPLEVTITTAGSNTGSVCYEERTYLEKVLEGVLTDETRFGIIFAIDDGDDPFNPQIWRKANPNLGVSVRLDYLENQARQAKATPTTKGEFLRKHCCRWSAAGVSAIDIDAWKACADRNLTLQMIAACDERIVAADGSKTDDITSLVAIGRKDGRLLFWEEHFATEALVDGPGNEHLAAWAEQGLIHKCAGHMIDLAAVEDMAMQMIVDIGATEFAYDPMYMLQMAQNLAAAAPQVDVVEQRQNIMSMDPGLRELQGMTADRRVVHRGSPVTSWMVSNARAKPRGEFLQLFKPQPHMKIDGVQAIVTGMARLATPTEEEDVISIPSGYSVSF